jgi:hypothetical protein
MFVPSLQDDRFWRRMALLLFLCLSLVVLITFRNYGLIWEEVIQKNYGEHLLHWYASGFFDSQSLTFGNSFLYGGFFEIVAQLATRISPLGLYETRHLVTAGFGLLAIVSTYRIGSNILSPAAGFFSALCLALTPVFYGHLFNNPKDVAFAALSTLALYFVIRTYDALPRIPSALLVKCGIAIGLCMGVRVGGVIVAGYMVLFWGWWMFQYARSEGRGEQSPPFLGDIVRQLGSILLIAWLVMLAFWPWALTSPVLNPWIALQATANFQGSGLVLFNGDEIVATDLPWTYLSTWLSISLPEFYLVTLLAGVLCGIRFAAKKTSIFKYGAISSKTTLLLFAICFPVVSAILLGSTVYDGMRQFLFILPLLAVVAGISFVQFLNLTRERWLKETVIGLTTCDSPKRLQNP